MSKVRNLVTLAERKERLDDARKRYAKMLGLPPDDPRVEEEAQVALRIFVGVSQLVDKRRCQKYRQQKKPGEP